MKMYTWSQQVLPAELLFWDICKGPIQAPFLETGPFGTNFCFNYLQISQAGSDTSYLLQPC